MQEEMRLASSADGLLEMLKDARFSLCFLLLPHFPSLVARILSQKVGTTTYMLIFPTKVLRAQHRLQTSLIEFSQSVV